MKYTLYAAAFCLLFAPIYRSQNSEINVVPKPRSVVATANMAKFNLNRKTKIVADTDVGRRAADNLNAILKREYGFTLGFATKRKDNTIIIDLTKRGAGESYSIKVVPAEVMISGEGHGLFYAIQSLQQVISASSDGSISIPSLEIRDSPRFPYRGMHLDVSRHFLPVEFVKKYIDLLAQYKFNYFHWHLTDDQGWRIEIKKYPKLTEIGSKRSESHEGPYSTIFKGDGRPVEGFYTQEQIKEVVAYAKSRYITAVPEIELPGHASAALAAYPELGKGCAAPNYKFEVKKTWGIFKEVFCPTEETFKFLEDVIDETIALFPDSPYVHIGGDEVLKDYWKESAFVQELKKRENLKDEHEVQSYFVQRIEKHVNKRGKKIIGWDEILEGGLAPNATVMSWRGMKGGIEAAKSKHDVIMTPTDFAYLDYGQGDPAFEPLNIGGYLPLEKVYQFDPVPKELTAEEAKYIIGGQANIWTEYLETPAAVEYMAFPRMLAIAESVWSQPENKNYADFERRLIAQFARLDKQNVNYRIPPPLNLANTVVRTDQQHTIENIHSAIPGARVLYTIDGSEPNANSPQIPAKLVLGPDGPKVQTLKTIVVLSNGRKSSIYAATIYRGAWLGAQPDPTSKTPGVNYSLYVQSNAYAQDTPPQNGESRSIGLAQFAQRVDSKKSFGVTFEGYINIAADGIYDFQIDSTWGRSLSIDGQMLIDEAGTKERAIKSAVVPLRAGWHKIAIRYDHREGDMFFRVRYGLKGQGLRQIGGGEIVH
ncbi:MAG: family 20 glycosylhydrolase [Pyrinomonadaceae bacterium]|nr:family 20 glycosylhydrolase [Pyrinomonadaceae bacterium]